MDFSQRDARAAAEKPQFCHLFWPESGEYIYDEKTGEAVGVMAVGSQSRKFQEELKAKSKDAMQKQGGESEAESLADLQKSLIEAASNVTTGFVNVQRCEVDENGEVILNKNGEPKNEWDATAPDDCAWFYDLYFLSISALKDPEQKKGQSFAQQIINFSNSIGNFLGNG